MRLTSSKSKENHEAQFPKLSIFTGQTLICRRYCIQNIKDGIQVYSINNENVSHFRLSISVTVKENLRNSQAQFREKLRKLRLMQNDCFLIKKTCSSR